MPTVYLRKDAKRCKCVKNEGMNREKSTAYMSDIHEYFQKYLMNEKWVERMKRLFTYLIFASMVLGLCACGQSAPTWQEQYDLGVRYLEESNYEEAIIAFTAAIEIDPSRAEAYIGRSDAYLRSSNTDENSEKARLDYMTAMTLMMDNETDYENHIYDGHTYISLADICIKLGDADSALEILTTYERECGWEENNATCLFASDPISVNEWTIGGKSITDCDASDLRNTYDVYEWRRYSLGPENYKFFASTESEYEGKVTYLEFAAGATFGAYPEIRGIMLGDSYSSVIETLGLSADALTLFEVLKSAGDGNVIIGPNFMDDYDVMRDKARNTFGVENIEDITFWAFDDSTSMLISIGYLMPRCSFEFYFDDGYTLSRVEYELHRQW